MGGGSFIGGARKRYLADAAILSTDQISKGKLIRVTDSGCPGIIEFVDTKEQTFRVRSFFDMKDCGNKFSFDDAQCFSRAEPGDASLYLDRRVIQLQKAVSEARQALTAAEADLRIFVEGRTALRL